MMYWMYLCIAIATEVVATIALKFVHGVSKPLPLGIVVVCYAVSFWALAIALRGLPIGLVYAVWAGVGTVAVALVGAVAFHESFGPGSAVSVAAIIGGVIGLNLASGGQ